ncbi:MAG TPA: acyl-CoA dehydrogenase family protein, partial [Tepidiformaceae bacterium]|nr:acyl-CoA dehydrogenase family protein [Tepidiformaceae bacterium]
MTPDDWIARARALAVTFSERSPLHDREGTFPYENFDDLREAGFLALTVPRAMGGSEASLTTFLRVQEELARGDGSTALALNMHLIRFGQERESPTYPPQWFAEMCRGAVEEGALCNTAATEEGLGSPAGGGLPDTTATEVEGGWLLAGRKTFTTMAPVLRYFIVLAHIRQSEGEPP